MTTLLLPLLYEMPFSAPRDGELICNQLVSDFPNIFTLAGASV